MSGPALARTLRTTEYFTLAFGAMVGVGWLIVIDDWLGRGGPFGAMLGFLIGGIALAPIAWVYGRFARAMPDAGSELAYASAAFPPAVGFAAAWLMTLAYLIVCPWEAVAIGKIVAYLAPAVESGELYRIAGRPVHAPALALGLGATLVVSLLNYRGIRLSARFQNTTTFALLALFGLFSALGLARGSAPNLVPPFSHATTLAGAVVSIVLVLQVVPYFLTGFESVPKASEEARSDLDPRSFARAIFAGLGCGVAFYVVVIGVVAGLEPWQALVEERFPTAAAFERAFRSPVAARLIIAAALVSLFKVFNANFLTASRLVFALGRRALIPARLGRIDPRFQSPAAAVVFCGLATTAGALLGDAILIPVTEVGSLASAFGWSITCLAFLRQRGKVSATGAGRAVAALGAAVALALVAIKLVPAVPGSFGPWEYAALGSWVGVGLLLRFLSLRAGPQK